MKEISEYKLLGYYLVKLHDLARLNSLNYEQVKSITQNVFNSIDAVNYKLLPLHEKISIVKNMINKGMFKTAVVGGKQTFVQVHNYEICKHIFANYCNDKSLVFRLPKELTSENASLLQAIKNTYEANINLELQSAIEKAIVPYLSKQKNRAS